MKLLKNLICIMLSFILVLVILMYMLYSNFESKFLNKDYILSKMNGNQFYLQIGREVESGFEKYIYQSGLPEETIKNLFTEEIIKNDVISIVNCVYDGTEINLSSQIIRNNLDNKIEQYLQSEGKNANEQVRENINKFEDLIVNEYNNNINISEELYTEAHLLIEKCNVVVEKIGNMPIIIIGIFVVLIILLNIKNLALALNFLSISILAVGVLIKLGITTIYSNINIDNLLILTNSISNLVISIIKEIIYEFDKISTTCVVLGVLGIAIYAIFKSLKSEKSINKY